MAKDDRNPQHAGGKKSDKGVSMGDVNKAVARKLDEVYARIEALETFVKMPAPAPTPEPTPDDPAAQRKAWGT